MITKAKQFKLDHPELLDRYNIEGMIKLIFSNNGVQWSDEGSFAISFDDGSIYNTYIISNYFIDDSESD
jgi:hypothetical protein